jgi:hypothetical protein
MDISFPVLVSDFPSGPAWTISNGWATQTFSWAAVLRAALVAGYPDLASLPSWQFSRFRMATLHVALRRSHGALIQPPEWRQFDPSEKGAIASILGVVVTKLLVERLMGAPLFLYVDVHFHFPPGPKTTRPDFLALTTGGTWFAAEAKGQARFRNKTLLNGKVQASAVTSVNGSPVQTGVVCVTSFRRGQMEARFADPPPAPGHGAKITAETMAVIRRYYGQLFRFREFSDRADSFAGIKNQWNAPLAFFRDLDVAFGLLPTVEHALREPSPERLFAVLREIDRQSMGDPFLGPDGIVVIPGDSWRV